MTEYVSNQAGNWHTATVWTPNGVPGNNDYVVINHAIVLDSNTTIGTSPGSSIQGNTVSLITGQTIPAITINGGNENLSGPSNFYTNNPTLYYAWPNGALTINAGLTLTARGDIICATGSLIMAAGSNILMDNSAAVAPASTLYILELTNTYNRYTGFLAINGTALNRCSIKSPNPGGWRIGSGWRTYGNQDSGVNMYDAGIVRATYCDFSNGGLPASTLTGNLEFASNTTVNIGTAAPTVVVQNASGQTATATYTTGSGTTYIEFNLSPYPDFDTSQMRMAPAGLNLNGGSFTQGGVTLSLVKSYTITQNSSTFLVTCAITWTANMVVTNTPQIVLSNGMACAYVSGTGTPTLTFTYQATGLVDVSKTMFDYFSPSASGTIKDSLGNGVAQGNFACWFMPNSASTDYWPFWIFRAQSSGGSTPTPVVQCQSCTFDHCTAIAAGPYGMVAGGYSVMFDDCHWTNGRDNNVYLMQNGYGVTNAGVDIFPSSIGALTGGDVRRLLRCVFSKPVSFYGADYWTRQYCVFGQGSFNGAQPGITTLHDSCLDRFQPGYVAGGIQMAVGNNCTYSNNLIACDSPVLNNTHGFGCGSPSGAGGPIYILNNIIDYQNLGGGFSQLCIGGNWTLSGGGPVGTTAWSPTNLTGNLLVITGNILTADYRTTTAYSGAPSSLANKYVPGGVITQDGTIPNINYACKIENNTFIMPAGIGAIDPNEPGTAPANTFYSTQGNIFYKPSIAGITCHAIWNRSDETNAVDMFDTVNHNCVWNGAADTSYINCPSGTIYAAGAAGTGGTAESTPGYYQICNSTSAIPGANDIHADPQLVDDTRSSAAYDAVYGGNGTVANLIAQLNNVYTTGSFYSRSGYTIPTALDEVRAWIRHGFTPLNLSLKGANYNGTDIGAVTVQAPPTWTTAAGALTAGVGAIAYTTTVVASSPESSPLTYSLVSGALPGGVTLNASTGVISGTPTNPSSTTTYSFTLGVNDGFSTVNAAFSIVIAVNQPTWTTTAGSLGTFLNNVAISGVSVTATDTHGQTISYAVTVGSLPAGLSLNTSSGAITGTPTTVASTTISNFTISASNGVRSLPLALAITISALAAPAWTTASVLPSGTGAVAYNHTVAATSQITVTYAVVSGSLPPGLSLASSTGVISGTPTNAATTTANFIITASDGINHVPQAFSLQIVGNYPTWATSAGSLGTFLAGATVAASVHASDALGQTISYALTAGALPAGLSFNTSTGAISGTAPGITGTSNFTVTANNTVGTLAQSFSMTLISFSPGPVNVGNPTSILPGNTLLGPLQTVNSGSTNGSLLGKQPYGSGGVRFYLTNGQSVTYTVAEAIPTAVPAATITITGSSTLGQFWFDENLGPGQMIFIISIGGSPLFRWLPGTVG